MRPGLWRAITSLVHAAAIVATLGACGEGRDELTISFDGDGFADGVVRIEGSHPLSATGIYAGSDGSLFVVGSGAVGPGDDAGTNARNLIIKLRPDGQPDRTFADQGVFVLAGLRDRFSGLAVRGDGSLIVLGALAGVPTIWQIDAGGIIDTTFGDAGSVGIDFSAELGASDWGAAATLAVVPGGSVVVAGILEGTSADAGYRHGNFAIRISPSGMEERRGFFPPEPDDHWWGILPDDSGGLLVFGERQSVTVHPLVGRLTADLELDVSFSPDGYARVAAVSSYCRAPVRLADGRYAAAGGALLLFAASGELDLHQPIDEDWLFSVGALPDGSMLGQLSHIDPAGNEYAVHISPAGGLDPDYGENGRSRGSGTAVGLVTTPGGIGYAAGWEWPDALYVRELP